MNDEGVARPWETNAHSLVAPSNSIHTTLADYE